MSPRFGLLSLLVFGVLASNATASDGSPKVIRNLSYGPAPQQVLDLYLTDQPGSPLIVWVHGGAWRAGSKDNVPILELVKRGYNIASVEYRLSPIAKFPAQVHDIKAAIRNLRAHATDHGYDASRVAIAGSSAGGHLAALVGVTNGHAQLEGTVGDHRETSSDVQAVIDLYGPTNFLTILKQSTPHGLSVRVPALQLLMGGQPEELPEPCRLASPVFHVEPSDPPLLLIHGDQDPQVPINQSHELHGRYLATKRPVQFEVVYGGAHGGDAFYDEVRLKLIDEFLRESFASHSPK